jgi:hypothetical protein
LFLYISGGANKSKFNGISEGVVIMALETKPRRISVGEKVGGPVKETITYSGT